MSYRADLAAAEQMEPLMLLPSTRSISAPQIQMGPYSPFTPGVRDSATKANEVQPKAKFGALRPKAHLLHHSPRERKYWDSGEYFMTKAGLAKMLDDVPFTPQQLEALPKLYN